MTDLIWLTNDHLSAAINPFGAELTHLRDADGAELMTDADPAFWPKHAPVLFPVIGMTHSGTIRVDGRDYPMSKHGFARDRMFAVVEQDATSVVFALAADAETQASYPFDFEVRLHFALDGATLRVTATIVNRDPDRPLLAQFGFHPAFAWPLPYGAPRSDHRIVFDRDEPGRLREIAPDGLIAAATADSPLEGRTLHLADALFAHDALVWDPVESDAVTYGGATGGRLRVQFPNTPALGIWTKPGAAFLCIEPWHGIADPEGFAGEFRDKPGVFEVAPGGEKRIMMNVTVEPR
ncbi:aldose 1-epimerase family protein [Sphingomonas sp. KR1UV-12]|uniref:Aldose 1-epimerase family protein n=1 Tax=Sphingomonas aurea TaxID=3063994 RepID=A0ABT9ELX0_9SPHN|nr:aldose 1-epimerase family protein [Sphingomonas sp. KR1UV-12]MDP1027936.1 aldose 1-epimerase family protein [Sphingomonas sp. KR1UV-12]